jgi:hypothetical protein
MKTIKDLKQKHIDYNELKQIGKQWIDFLEKENEEMRLAVAFWNYSDLIPRIRQNTANIIWIKHFFDINPTF